MLYDDRMQQVNINLMPWRRWRRVRSGRNYLLLLFALTLFFLTVTAYNYRKLNKDVLGLQAIQQQWQFNAGAQKWHLKVEQTIALNKHLRAVLLRIEHNIPEGVVLKHLKLQEKHLYLSGEAVSEHQIKAFLSVFDAGRLLSITSSGADLEFNMEVVVE